MGREVQRVPMDFDWPMGRIWLGYMAGVCESDVEYILGRAQSKEDPCDVCRHAARLAGIATEKYGCPKWRVHPPAGDGWQMWETVTEGSPISPVFRTPEELARWLVENKASAFGTMTATYDQWLAMITSGWAPSAMIQDQPGKIMSGVEAVAALAAAKKEPAHD